ncbi:ABC transporter substrate-binding protein [Geodermatophilus sabuli]|uniref:NitT/TauT family transport system substrate-binding protein n=1 Tax=Geodermatophilus sabuli TaxID=1564158 RepID=A0A285EK23_9ACTN|nr:ABC transporter substrate-binding protein [Geodermatophilus sabuli]MBB3087022.1 NitT/TauT family transport system substrate-binding protein [Geodermatophilus sabuli]SNX99360.1 NitT/TauT family transport system substrate-binding protein [Geodermatophilus sabuli]
MTAAPASSGRRPSRRLAGLALGCAASLALAACGSDDAGGGTASGGGEGPAQLTVGYFPLVHTAIAVHADEAGLFDEQDLDVTLEQTSGGAQAIPSLIAGEYDITYGNYTSALLAAQQGLPVRIIAGNDVGAEDHAIMVAPDSPYQAPADLAGARIAVNNLQNIGTVAVNAILEDAGVDVSTIQFLELPYPDMAAALDAGDVDAIWQVEPFQASAKASGARVLFPLFSGPVDDMPVAGWLTTEQYAQENPEVIESFRAAMAASMAELQGNREELVRLVPTYSQVPAETVEQVQLPEWDAEVDRQQLQKMSDLMLEYGIISEEFDVETMIAG